MFLFFIVCAYTYVTDEEEIWTSKDSGARSTSEAQMIAGNG
jgi:hypothetical protein